MCIFLSSLQYSITFASYFLSEYDLCHNITIGEDKLSDVFFLLRTFSLFF